ASRGVITLNNPSECDKDRILVIRSHGVTEETYKEIESLGLTYEDATCPFVSKIHKIVSTARDENSVVLIAGDPKHPEVIGIKSFAGDKSYVFSSPEELEEIVKTCNFFANFSIVMVSQTTLSEDLWKKSEEFIKKVCTNAKIFDTICDATSRRQSEAKDLSQKCDLMVVIGGKHSSNTAKLYDICLENCPTYLVETAAELPFINPASYSLVGVTAGASTPFGIIKEVQTVMSEIIENAAAVVEETAAEAQTELVNNPESEVAQVSAAVEEKSSGTDIPAVKSYDEMTDEEAFEYSLSQMNSDQHVKGYVLAVTPTEIQVDIGRKHAGYVPYDEYSYDSTIDLKDEVKVGDILDLIVMRTNDQEGTVMLSKKRFDSVRIWDEIYDAVGTETQFEGKVKEAVKGGVIVMSRGVRVFVPASLATESREQSTEDLVGTTVNFRIIEAVRGNRRRIVGAIRAPRERRQPVDTSAFWAAIEEGKIYTGKVKSLTSYGAFVDLGGVDGMVHISELSWKRVKHPSEVVNVDDVIEVFVKSFDAEKKKVSLGYKKQEDNPWNVFLRDYKVEDVIDVKIVSITAYGAFANIIDGVDGLIHISQIAHERIAKPQDVLSVGQTVQVKITQIDLEKKRISLSIKELLEKPAEEVVEEAAPEAVEETPAEAPVEEATEAAAE
ncbi:MAG: 4-hydroxy-3-methylbut-2-enyl diphosphate reductase, partial [Clostridia bacterium]|nr:4-hydroxy-3-methylbut-2-enyl diphosphate reductase [Clostridia bacterium]